MQTANGNGKIILDPKLGIKIQGLNGQVLEDKFYVDNDGNVVLKGSLTAGSTITGATFTGGSLSIGNGALKIAEDGSLDIGNGNFVVDAAGNLTANSGTFSGTIRADKISGEVASSNITNTLNDKNLVGGSLNIGNGAFVVDGNGNVTIKSGSISWDAVTGTEAVDDAIANAQNTADEAAEAAYLAENDLIKLAKGQYTKAGTTFINGTSIYSPNIYGGKMSVRSNGESGYGAQLYNNQLQFYDGVVSNPMGYIEYYESSNQNPNNAAGGIRIKTVTGSGERAIKLEASGGIALAGKEIYFYTDKYSGKSLSDIIDSGGAVFG